MSLKVSANSMHIAAQFAIGAALYVVMSLLYVRVVDPSASVLVVVLVLAGLRLSLAFVEWGIESCAWHLVGRRAKIQELVSYYEETQFPQRPEHVGLMLYLPRLADGSYDNKVAWPQDAEFSRDDLKEEARRLSDDLETNANARMKRAFEAAFDRYSPLKQTVSKGANPVSSES